MPVGVRESSAHSRSLSHDLCGLGSRGWCPPPSAALSAMMVWLLWPRENRAAHSRRRSAASEEEKALCAAVRSQAQMAGAGSLEC